MQPYGPEYQPRRKYILFLLREKLEFVTHVTPVTGSTLFRTQRFCTSLTLRITVLCRRAPVWAWISTEKKIYFICTPWKTWVCYTCHPRDRHYTGSHKRLLHEFNPPYHVFVQTCTRMDLNVNREENIFYFYSVKNLRLLHMSPPSWALHWFAHNVFALV